MKATSNSVKPSIYAAHKPGLTNVNYLRTTRPRASTVPNVNTEPA